jgi:flagellar hook-basal body complex protein FliE
MTIPVRPQLPQVVSPLEQGRGIQLELGTESSSFSEVFTRVLNDASQLQTDSRNLIEAFVRGEPVELHQVMAAAEEAAISLEFLVEIRNKLTDAYRAVMNMQA